MIGIYKKESRKLRLTIIALSSMAVLLLITAGIVIFSTFGRTQLQFDVRQNKEIIHLSTFAEPPQFAIWLENAGSHKLKTVFVTSRVSKGDWEGKANVPVALPRWFELFRGENQSFDLAENDEFSAVTGATPKDDYFSVRIEVEPGSEWICWIEMNLAGDYNESFPEFDLESLKEDEFSCGQPALLFKAAVEAKEGLKFTPVLEAQSVWEKGVNRVEPVSDGVTTARNVFDDIQITVIRPKPKLVEKNKITNNYKQEK
jgi:hypothetical protein